MDVVSSQKVGEGVLILRGTLSSKEQLLML